MIYKKSSTFLWRVDLIKCTSLDQRCEQLGQRIPRAPVIQSHMEKYFYNIDDTPLWLSHLKVKKMLQERLVLNHHTFIFQYLVPNICLQSLALNLKRYPNFPFYITAHHCINVRYITVVMLPEEKNLVLHHHPFSLLLEFLYFNPSVSLTLISCWFSA